MKLCRDVFKKVPKWPTCEIKSRNLLALKYYFFTLLLIFSTRLRAYILISRDVSEMLLLLFFVFYAHMNTRCENFDLALNQRWYGLSCVIL